MKCILLLISVLSLLTQSYSKSTDQSIKSTYPVLKHDSVNDLTPFDQLRGSPYKVGFNNRSITITTNSQSIKHSMDQPLTEEDVTYNVLLQSGSIHYPRSTPGMWPGLFKRAREGGLNTIQVYFFWNYNNENRYEYDFLTDNRNLGQFIEQAGEAGLFVNLRIGPFVCAEWTLGGIPQWVRDLGIPFRTNNSVWENEMEIITQYVVKYTEQYQAINGGPIILMQIENEYDNMEGSNAGNKEYLQWAANLTQKVAPDSVWVMCSSHDAPSFVINTCNGFYCDGWISGHRQNFPNQPSLWTEDWSGWFYAWGEAKPRRPAQDLAFAVARWMARGGAHHNYYMYQGGTTFGRWTGGPQDVTSYDYDAPLDEYGYPNEPKYSHVGKLHSVLDQYANAIIGNPIPVPVTVGQTGEIHVYGDCSVNQCLQFWSNWDVQNELKMSLNGQSYVLPAWSVWLIDGAKNQILYQTNMIDPSIKITDRKSHQQSIKADPDNIVYIEETIGIYDQSKSVSMTRTPEMLTFTHDKTDYLWHVQNVTLTDQQIKNGSIFLTLNNVNEFVFIFFGDDRELVSMGVNVGKSTYQISVQGFKAGQTYQLKLLVVTMGSANCCGGLEGFTRGIQGNVLIDNVAITHNTWQLLSFLQGERESYLNSTTVNWSTGQHAFKPLTWYKLSIKSPEPTTDDPSWQLDLAGMNKGQIWINGHAIGRYWLIEATQKCSDECDWRGNYGDSKCRYDCHEPSLRLYHVPRDWLMPVGELNEIVLLEEEGGDPATITLLQRN